MAGRWIKLLLAGALLAVLAACDGPLPVIGDEPSVATDVREFGIASDPWGVDEWSAAVGARPTMVMEFEQWSRNRTLETHFQAAREQGMKSFVICWEPWQSVPAELGKVKQFAEQPDYSNATIAAGKQDAYVRMFARSLKRSGLTIYLRFAHEMNGDWYPWSRDPENYVKMWRHVHDIFADEGATNVRWVYSLNPTPYEGETTWTENIKKYWPGPQYVDYLGTTMINFGGIKEKSVDEFAQRIRSMHTIFGKELFVMEFNSAAEGRLKWFTDLRTWLATEASWIRGVVLSQAVSRGKIQLGSKVGNLSWNVTSDPQTRPVVKALIDDFRKEPGRAPTGSTRP